MKVLVTGGTGFVGSHLVPELLRRGITCRLLTRSIASVRHRFPGEVEFCEGDVTRAETLEGVAQGVTHVIHMAAEGHVTAMSDEALRSFVNVNVRGTDNLLRACSGYGILRFVHFSSTAAMGRINKAGRIDERDTPQPATPYQQSKLASERAARETGRHLGIPVVILRPCMIYGPGGKGEFYKFCRLMAKGMFPRVGLGANLTPLVHVRDVVQSAMLALEKGLPDSVYLVASERSLPMAEMRRLILKHWGGRAMYPYVPLWAMLAFAWGFEQLGQITGKAPLVTRRNVLSTVASREFSIEKAQKELGYQPTVPFDQGIGETVAWYREVAV